jgi:LacI family transcriptional regulator, purine nucleotide synthesis repressor
MATLKPKSKMTLQKIAALAGVSSAAVSAVLNNRWKEIRLTEQTRDKIEEVLKKNQFQPHPVGKALAFRRSFMIGMVVEEINFSFLPEALQGVEDYTEQKGCGLLLMTTRKDHARAEQVVKFLLARNVDGILIGPLVDLPKPMRQTLAERKVPLVFLGRPEESSRHVCVDGFQIGALGIRHLLGRGHRHIACWGMSGKVREGISQTASEFEGKKQIDHWPLCTYQDAMELYTAASPRPTALFAYSDEMACKLLNLAIRRGIQVPGQLALMGIDDTPAAAEAVIPLTTIGQPKYEQGLAAAQILFDLIEGKPGKNITLKPKLVIRETT